MVKTHAGDPRSGEHGKRHQRIPGTERAQAAPARPARAAVRCGEPAVRRIRDSSALRRRRARPGSPDRRRGDLNGLEVPSLCPGPDARRLWARGRGFRLDAWLFRRELWLGMGCRFGDWFDPRVGLNPWLEPEWLGFDWQRRRRDRIQHDHRRRLRWRRCSRINPLNRLLTRGRRNAARLPVSVPGSDDENSGHRQRTGSVCSAPAHRADLFVARGAEPFSTPAERRGGSGMRDGRSHGPVDALPAVAS